MVCPRSVIGSHLDGLGGRRIPELGREDNIRVGEGQSISLAAGDEDLAVKEEDAVSEGACEPHRVNGCDCWVGPGVTKGDYVSVACSVAVPHHPSWSRYRWLEGRLLSGYRVPLCCTISLLYSGRIETCIRSSRRKAKRGFPGGIFQYCRL